MSANLVDHYQQFTGTTVATHVHVGLLWVSDCVTETHHLIFKNFQSIFQISLSFSKLKKSLSFPAFPEL